MDSSDRKPNPKDAYEPPSVLASYSREDLEVAIGPKGGTPETGGGGCGTGCITGCGCG